jgi:hypothetical protein
LHSDHERIAVERLAIDDSCPSPEVTRQGPKIQPVIQFPGFTQNDASAVGAYVFRNAFLRTKTHIQAAEVHSYRQWHTFFQPTRNRFHEIPHGPEQNWEGGLRGGYDPLIILSPQRNGQKFEVPRGFNLRNSGAP